MTVNDLIDKLSELNPNYEIGFQFYTNNECGEIAELLDIWEVHRINFAGLALVRKNKERDA